MTLVGGDLHARKQQVAALDTDTGEIASTSSPRTGDPDEQFYASLPRPATV